MPRPPETLTLSRLTSPVGDILLVTDAESAVRALDFAGYEPRMMRLLKRHWGEVVLNDAPAPASVRAGLEAYFAGDLSTLERMTVRTNGTAFQERVWAALRSIPAGETRSYGELAAMIDAPRAVRAAGLANGQNPVALATPCHRVIGANGSLTGYAGGLERKRSLLAHEGAPGLSQAA